MASVQDCFVIPEPGLLDADRHKRRLRNGFVLNDLKCPRCLMTGVGNPVSTQRCLMRYSKISICLFICFIDVWLCTQKYIPCATGVTAVVQRKHAVSSVELWLSPTIPRFAVNGNINMKYCIVSREPEPDSKYTVCPRYPCRLPCACLQNNSTYSPNSPILSQCGRMKPNIAWGKPCVYCSLYMLVFSQLVETTISFLSINSFKFLHNTGPWRNQLRPVVTPRGSGYDPVTRILADSQILNSRLLLGETFPETDRTIAGRRHWSHHWSRITNNAVMIKKG